MNTITRFIGTEKLMLRDDGRTVEGRIVPYGEVAEVLEQDSDTGEVMRYREQFLPGSCVRMAQGFGKRGNASPIAFCLEHDESLRDGQIGYCKSLTSEDDGAYATFRLYEDAQLTKWQSMLRESHTGLSVMFADIRPPKVIDGVISRVQVFIRHVAATTIPQYEGAAITAMRSAEEIQLHGTPELDRVKLMLEELKGTANV